MTAALGNHDELPLPAAAIPEILPMAMARARFRDWTFGASDETVRSATAVRDQSLPGVLVRRETLQLVVRWSPSDDAQATAIWWDVFDYSAGQLGEPNRTAAREFGFALRFAIYGGAPPSPPPHNPVVKPGEDFDGRYTGTLRDYSFCATPEDVRDLRDGVLPLGVHAFGDRSAGGEGPEPVWYGDPLFLSEYRSGKPMLYNGTLVCAPQNSGKTMLIRRWAAAANAAGYNLLLIDVKGNLHQDLLTDEWRGEVYRFSTNPSPGAGEPPSDRINFLAGYLDDRAGITPVASDRITQLVTALLPSEGWTGKGGQDEFHYRNRVIWLTAFIHLLLLRQLFYPWKFRQCRRISEACRATPTAAATQVCKSLHCSRTADLGDLYELVADERLLYTVIGELRAAEARLAGRGLPPLACGVDYWMRELALVIDRRVFPEGNRPERESYQSFTAGLKQALAPFARHGTLYDRVRDEGDGRLFRLEALGAEPPDDPVTILVAAREQDHVNAETVLAMTMARVTDLLYDRRSLRDPRPVLLLLDETRRIRNFRPNEYITFARDAKAGCVIVYQSLDQIGETPVIVEILENVGTQIYLGSLVGHSAQHFIDLLPKRYRATHQDSVQRNAGGVTRTTNVGKELVDAFTTHDLYRLPAGEWPALVYVTDQPRRPPLLVDMDEARMPRPRARPPFTIQRTGVGQRHTAGVSSVSFWPGGTHLVSAAANDYTVVWTLDDGAIALMFDPASGGGRCGAASANGALLATGGADGRVTICDSTTGHVLRRLEAHTAPVVALAFDPRGAWLATASADGSLVISVPDTGVVHTVLTGHAGDVTGLAIVPDGTAVVAVSGDGTAIQWRTDDWTETARITAGVPLACVAAGASVVVGGAFGFREWDVRANQWLDPVGTASVRALAAWPGRDFVAAGLDSGDVQLWRLHPPRLWATVPLESGAVTALAGTPGEPRLAAGTRDGGITILSMPDAFAT